MNDWYDTPEPRLEPKDPVQVTGCDICCSIIYEGDRYYKLLGHNICAECVDLAECVAVTNGGVLHA